MGFTQLQHSKMINILKNKVGRAIRLKVPLINSTTGASYYNVTALVSAISNNEIGSTTLLTIETIVCKLIIDNLTAITNCPSVDLKKKNVTIFIGSTEYTIAKEDPNAFNDMIVLYLNRKG